MKKALLVVSLALTGLTLSSCFFHRFGHHEHDAAIVVVPGHVHTDDCGHYFHHGQWYHSAHHVHGSGCGHVFRDGIWIVVD